MTLYSDALTTQRKLANDILNQPRVYVEALVAWDEHVLHEHTSPKQMAHVLEAIYNMVHTGDTYFMASQIEDGLITAASVLPTDCQIHKESFPSNKGFMLLEHPLPPLMRLDDVDLGHIVAFSWWGAILEDFQEVAVLVGWQYTNHNMLQPCIYLKVEDGDTVDNILAAPSEDAGITRMVKFVVATFNFLEQQLLEPAITALPRQQRRQAERTHPTSTNTVNVIRLRRKYTQHPNSDAHIPIEHDFQWMVRGHWRKQPYRSKGPDFYKHIFIQPYVKGPDDKPLKGTDRVYAIVR